MWTPQLRSVARPRNMTTEVFAGAGMERALNTVPFLCSVPDRRRKRTLFSDQRLLAVKDLVEGREGVQVIQVWRV